MGMPFWKEPEEEKPSQLPIPAPPPSEEAQTEAYIARVVQLQRDNLNERMDHNPFDFSLSNSPPQEAPQLSSPPPAPISVAENEALYGPSPPSLLQPSQRMDYDSAMSRAFFPEMGARRWELLHGHSIVRDRESERAMYGRLMLGRVRREEPRIPELRSPSPSRSERSLSSHQRSEEPRSPPGAPLRSPSPSPAPSGTETPASLPELVEGPFPLAEGLSALENSSNSPPAPSPQFLSSSNSVDSFSDSDEVTDGTVTPRRPLPSGRSPLRGSLVPPMAPRLGMALPPMDRPIALADLRPRVTFQQHNQPNLNPDLSVPLLGNDFDRYAPRLSAPLAPLQPPRADPNSPEHQDRLRRYHEHKNAYFDILLSWCRHLSREAPSWMVERIDYRPEIAALANEDFMSDPFLASWKSNGIEGLQDGVRYICSFISFLVNPYFFYCYQNLDEVVLLRQFVDILCHDTMHEEKRIWDKVISMHVGFGVEQLHARFLAQE